MTAIQIVATKLVTIQSNPPSALPSIGARRCALIAGITTLLMHFRYGSRTTHHRTRSPSPPPRRTPRQPRHKKQRYHRPQSQYQPAIYQPYPPSQCQPAVFQPCPPPQRYSAGPQPCPPFQPRTQPLQQSRPRALFFERVRPPTAPYYRC